jgi:hypothetical protein
MPSILELRDDPLTTDDPVSKGDGRHIVREEPDDIVIYAHVKDGVIEGFSARRREQGLKIVHVTVLVDGDPTPVTYVCFTTPEGRTFCNRNLAVVR